MRLSRSRSWSAPGGEAGWLPTHVNASRPDSLSSELRMVQPVVTRITLLLDASGYMQQRGADGQTRMDVVLEQVEMMLRDVLLPSDHVTLAFFGDKYNQVWTDREVGTILQNNLHIHRLRDEPGKMPQLLGGGGGSGASHDDRLREMVLEALHSMKARAEAPGSDAAQDPHAVRAKVLNLLVVFTDGLSAASKSEFSRTVTDTSSRLGMPNFNFRIITARNASAGAPAAAGHRSEGLIRAEAADGAIAAEPPAFAEGSSLDEHDHANLRAAKAYGRAAPGGGKFQLSWSNGRDVAGTHARVLPCIPEHHRLSRMSDPAAQRRACAHAVLPDPVATAMFSV
uniref:VWFA domain-containing protein n=1 Tax=Chlamydomonas euryale TaxID=1486919 RepID=A0A7R9V4S8_9CHLO